jgi:hypothetical protein
MNDEESGRPEVVGKFNEPYAMRTQDCHMVSDGPGVRCIVIIEGDILGKLNFGTRMKSLF